MKLKLINIISIFIVIIVIGYILLPWSKQNINIENFGVEVVNSVSESDKVISLADYILNSRIFAENTKHKINQ